MSRWMMSLSWQYFRAWNVSRVKIVFDHLCNHSLALPWWLRSSHWLWWLWWSRLLWYYWYDDDDNGDDDFTILAQNKYFQYISGQLRAMHAIHATNTTIKQTILKTWQSWNYRLWSPLLQKLNEQMKKWNATAHVGALGRWGAIGAFFNGLKCWHTCVIKSGSAFVSLYATTAAVGNW